MIRFPRMHIAESVANRIMNLVHDMRETGIVPPPGMPTEPPELPQPPIVEGAALDQELATPPPQDMEVPPALALPGAGP